MKPLKMDRLKLLGRRYFEVLGLIIVLGLFLRFFVISFYRVADNRMAPDLQSGDIVMGLKLPFSFFAVSANEIRVGRRYIFVCEPGGASLCSGRLAAKGPSKVQLLSGTLVVNGESFKYQTLPWPDEWSEAHLKSKESVTVWRESMPESSALPEVSWSIIRHRELPSFEWKKDLKSEDLLFIADNRTIYPAEGGPRIVTKEQVRSVLYFRWVRITGNSGQQQTVFGTHWNWSVLGRL